VRITLKNNSSVNLRLLKQADEELLFAYFENLSAQTKSRFGPHPFNKENVHLMCRFLSPDILRYIALDAASNKIIAYMLIRKGLIEADKKRFMENNTVIDEATACSFAPSVADDWQGTGLGSKMFSLIENDLKEKTSYKTIVLWGGVQASNQNAVLFYLKNGFVRKGNFMHNNMDNQDMLKEL
jgi:ribosomal protein S18 acetylase RimI-like enzyme